MYKGKSEPKQPPCGKINQSRDPLFCPSRPYPQSRSGQDCINMTFAVPPIAYFVILVHPFFTSNLVTSEVAGVIPLVLSQETRAFDRLSTI